MPLSEPGCDRRQYHTRDIQEKGFFRADGLWDIEGHMRDTKTYPFVNSHRGTIEPGEAVHDMLLRITIDDDMVIHGAEAVTVMGPYSLCGDIAPDYEQLIGLRVGAGFHREVKKRLGGVQAARICLNYSIQWRLSVTRRFMPPETQRGAILDCQRIRPLHRATSAPGILMPATPCAPTAP